MEAPADDVTVYCGSRSLAKPCLFISAETQRKMTCHSNERNAKARRKLTCSNMNIQYRTHVGGGYCIVAYYLLPAQWGIACFCLHPISRLMIFLLLECAFGKLKRHSNFRLHWSFIIFGDNGQLATHIIMLVSSKTLKL